MMKRISKEKALFFLEEAQKRADDASGCKKVAVGSALLPVWKSEGTAVIFGANRTLPVNCRKFGCRREDLYGENSKAHRLPSDCRAIHSEVDAICTSARMGVSLEGATIVVTRYPCEACARAIVDAGIKCVMYGRKQEISEETKKIFESNNVEVIWLKEWSYEDTEV